MMKDSEIVELYWKRDETAITETQIRYKHLIRGIAYRILCDNLDCDEVENDTYLGAWNSMPTNRPSVLSAYLCRIARRISIDIFRKKHSEKRSNSLYAVSYEELEGVVGERSEVYSDLERKELSRVIDGFLSTLDDNSRNIFVGRYFYFYPIKQIAEDLNEKPGNVKAVLFRTRERLKKYLVKEGYDI